MKMKKNILFIFFILAFPACGNQEITIDRIDKLYLNKEYEKIVNTHMFNRDLNIFNDNPDLLNKLGVSYYKLGMISWASTYFSKAIELNDKESIYHSNLAMAEIDLAKYLPAISSCIAAIELDDENFNAYINRSLAYIKLEDWDAALKDLLKSLTIKNTLKSELAIAFANLGTVYLNMGEDEKALEYSLEAMKINAQLPWIYKNLAYLKLQENNIKEAIAYVKTGLRLKPKDEMLLYYKGVLLVKSGNEMEGCELMKMAFKKINRINSNEKINKNYTVASKTIKEYCN